MDLNILDTLRVFEYGLSPAAFILLIAYHVLLYRRVRHKPIDTSQELFRYVRSRWVHSVMTGGKDILAIQTLRNWTMAATFLASTAILIGLGIFNLAVTVDKQGELSLLLAHLGSKNPSLWLGKLILLGGDFLFAFFNFTLAIRYYIHTGFMISLHPDANTDITIEQVADTLNRGGLHYTIGMRGYYLSIPFALWLFGPIWLLIGSITVLAVLYQLDRKI